MLLRIFLTTLLFVLALTARGAPPDRPSKSTRQVMIQVRVVEGDPAGSAEAKTQRVLAEPTLVTMYGRPASFRSGGEIAVRAEGDRMPRYVEFGTSLNVELELTDDKHASGSIHLLVEQPTQAIAADAQPVASASLVGVSHRVAGKFPLGKTIRIPDQLPQGRVATWAEIVVTEVAATRSGNSPPTYEAVPRLPMPSK